MSAGAATPKAGGRRRWAVPELYGPLVPQRGGIVSPQCFAARVFFFLFCCSSGFSLPQLSQPGKLPLVVPNAAPLGLLVLSVKTLAKTFTIRSAETLPDLVPSRQMGLIKSCHAANST